MENTKNNQQEKEPSIPLKPMTLLQLSQFYGVSRKTLKSWMDEFKEELGTVRGRIFNVKQVKIVFENLGIPGMYTEK